MNVITITGNIGKDVEKRTTANGKEVASFSVGVRNRMDKDSTTWFNCQAWGQQASYISEYGGKGRKVAVAGRMESRKYTDKDGNERLVWDLTADNIELLDRPRDEQGEVRASPGATTPPAHSDFDPFEDE
jgi:single-strand DNA-binding protein